MSLGQKSFSAVTVKVEIHGQIAQRESGDDGDGGDDDDDDDDDDDWMNVRPFIARSLHYHQILLLPKKNISKSRL